MAWFAALRSQSRRATGETMLGGVAILRRLAAIGAEVPGYLQPVKADRKGALARRNRIDSKFALHKGRALKSAGAVQATSVVAG